MLEFSLATESIQALINWLAIGLGLSALVCLRFVAPLLRRSTRCQGLGMLGRFLLAGLTSLQLLAWHLYFYRESHDAIELGYVLGALAVGMFLWRLVTAPNSWLHRRWARSAPTALACLAMLQLAGFAVATQCFAESKPSLVLPTPAPPGDLVVSGKASARTDRGTALDLYERTASVEEYQTFLDNARRSVHAVTARAMRRDLPQISSNCHGWVFTGGQFIVRGGDVQTILDENGYVEVATPGLDDVVIYRDPTRGIVHTGVVRGFLSGKLPLVESKWGAEGTYLHLPTEQPYSQDISYWHTDRGSHVLAIEPAE